MKVLIVVPDYPNKHSVSYQFVHDRVKEYKKHMMVDVFCYDTKFKNKYNYENVTVYGGGKKELLAIIKSNNYSCFVFHFLNIRNASFILRFLKEERVFIWFHGSDCISWKRRLSSINYKKKKLININFLLKLIAFIIYNKNRLLYIKRLNQKCSNITFVFVSEWNLRVSENDINIKYKNYAVIPNYIKLDEFKYHEKEEKQRLQILSINNYANDIYAGDMICDIILKFSTKKEFKHFKFNIYGYGSLFDQYMEKIKDFDNVSIQKGLLKPGEIASLHKNNGIFLYPKRGDSQGVLRCEAMASGLVPIASNVEAVSEFSPHFTTYLVKDTDDFIKALLNVYYDPKEFLAKSKKGGEFISNKCSYENTIKKEIDLFVNF